MKPYVSAIQDFSLNEELRDLEMASGGALNAAVICCDQHTHDDRKVALRYRNASGEGCEWTFGSLKLQSERLARLLARIIHGTPENGLADVA